MDIDLRAVLGALGGAALYGFVQFGAKIKGGHDVTTKEYADLAINIACAASCGVILTALLAKSALPLIPFAGLRDVQMVGLFFGAFGWELLPLAFDLVKIKVRKKAAEAGADVEVKL
jgi:hypothetical protein